MDFVEGTVLYKSNCPSCPSSDAYAIYSNGTRKCFSCGYFTYVNEEESEQSIRKTTKMREELIYGEPDWLQVRKIPKEICAKYSYHKGKDKKDVGVQIANYYNEEGEKVAQKLRYADKTFKFIGEPKEALLYGQQLFAKGGKKVTVTEGEIDTLSVATAFNGKYPVVSIKNGCQAARKELSKHIEWLNSFDEVYLWFDNDEVGRKAVEECIPLFPAGKVKVIQHPECKDANEVLVKHGAGEVANTFYNAKEFRPDGVLTLGDLVEDLKKPIEEGVPWCFPTLTKWTYGRRKGELYAFGSGTGNGKTDIFTQQITYDVSVLKKKVGLFFLEQNPLETARRIAGKVDGKLYHVPATDENNWTQEQLNDTIEELSKSPLLYLFNNFGSNDWNNIQSKIRLMVHNLGVEHIYLDHLTALSSHADDERRFLDGLMEEMASLAQELQVCIHFISHLATPTGTPHEEGGRVMAKHFRGSRSIQQWSFFMFGLERNQQAKNVADRSKSILRCLKDRYTGQANGSTLSLGYNARTGILEESNEDFVLDGEDFNEDF